MGNSNGDEKMIRLWPKDFEKKTHISKEERNVLRTASKYFKEGHMVIGIDPIGMSTDECRMGMYISPKEGVVSFTIYKGKINPAFISMYINLVKMAEDQIYERLINSKTLIVRNGQHKELKFPYKHIIMFHDEDINNSECSKNQLKDLHPYAVAKFFRPLDPDIEVKKLSDLRIFSNTRKPFDKGFKEISENEAMAVFERLAPEYTIVMNEKEQVECPKTKDVITDNDLLITGKESEYRTFWLDEYQVGLVNEMGKGHRVILANPGAGKSVILLSKAFKYASLCKNSNVLLTCYNANLAESYRFKRDCADFGNNKNLTICTLHALVGKIYRDVLKINFHNEIATAEDIQKCIDYINNGKLKLRFKAIFIDEVQIFEPSYLDLCYALLEEGEDSIFLMAGDLNQNVRTQSRRGDAPWKKMNNVTLDYTGRVRYIEKNYRNSVEIGEYLNRMLKYMNKQMDSLNMLGAKEYDYNVFEKGNKKGIALKIENGVSRMDVTQKVIDALDIIVNKYNVPYSDIAILYPVRQNRALKYYFQLWIDKELNDRGIPHCFISNTDDPYGKVKYTAISGVVISSISSSLGLDFKAVIIAGLFPYNYIFTNGEKVKISNWNIIKKLNADQRDDVQKEMREIYTACSRARELLYVVSDLDKNSPMEQILLSGKATR